MIHKILSTILHSLSRIMEINKKKKDGYFKSEQFHKLVINKNLKPNIFLKFLLLHLGPNIISKRK